MNLISIVHPKDREALLALKIASEQTDLRKETDIPGPAPEEKGPSE